MLVIKINKLKSPVTLCLTNTKINAVKLVSSSAIDRAGLRQRILCDRPRVKLSGTRRTGLHLRTLGSSVHIRT